MTTYDDRASLTDLTATVERVRSSVEGVIEGKPEVVRLSLTVLLAEGHLLIEDVPGVGKTMLAKALAKSIDCSVRRIQFTPDLLPSDITGVSIWDQQRRDFEFKPGAIFAQIVIGLNSKSRRCWSQMDTPVMSEGKIGRASCRERV